MNSPLANSRLPLALFAIILIQVFSCAPLRPLAPQQQVQKAQKAKSGVARTSQVSQKWEHDPIKNSSDVQEITGISSWDKVLSPWLGTPYLYGGNSEYGVDCSGFVSRVYLEKEGMYIPRTTSEEFKNGKSVSKGDLTVGDLVFFGERKKVSHVGIYVGNGNFMHASTSLGVTITPLDDSHWQPLYIGARRYL